MPYQADLRHAASISPIKLFEALAAGRLVLASDLPSIREVVCDGKNGLLLPPDNPESWVAAIEKVRTNPAWALEMAKRGRETAREYSWSARARNLLNFMESTSR
jgi:glycosyltransferase involved in cell wall biosynthesis